MEALGKRVIAAAVLLPLVVGGVLVLPTPGLALMLGVFALVGGVEWTRLGDLRGPARGLFLGVLALLMGLTFAVHRDQDLVRALMLVAAGYWLLALRWVVQFQRCHRVPVLEAMPLRALCGWLVLVPAWLALLALHARSPWLLLYLLALIWVADIAAFFAGRRFGRRRLASAVSPGKTWEGVAAGLAAVAVLALAAAGALGAGMLAPLALSVLAAAASVLGDLAESMFKRRAKLKDSGSLIPGHGGVLDRIDSVTAAAPVFALGALGWSGAP